MSSPPPQRGLLATGKKKRETQKSGPKPRHCREGGNPDTRWKGWVPACAGMTFSGTVKPWESPASAGCLPVQIIRYKWYPLFGLEVIVHHRVYRPQGLVFRCQVNKDDNGYRPEIQDWMFEPEVCSRMQLSKEPHVTLDALEELRNLLDHAICKKECQNRILIMKGESDGKVEKEIFCRTSTRSLRTSKRGAGMGEISTGNTNGSHRFDRTDGTKILGKRRRKLGSSEVIV